MSGPVVVGVDGSRSNLAVVEVAAQAAERLGVGLELTQVVGWPAAAGRFGIPSWETNGAGGHASKQGALAEAERHAHSAAPRVRISREVLVGEPENVLECVSRSASLTVVGADGAQAYGTLRNGSLARRLSARVSGPLLVVRGRPNPVGPVLLAVHGTSTLRGAAEFAFAEASARGADLVAVHARPYGGSAQAVTEDEEDVALAGALAGLRERYPDVTLRCRRPHGRSRRALVEASADSQLLVVGARGRFGFVGLPLDPVCQTALNEADCPVALVHC
ncbi:universal stress protein [Streptomyces sp. MBT65]|uniref:universal stress protein n=1 Tax=Streptomyces sp. MBT65 TaxID=1488395 RepID=UPI00190D2D61|nr:universal stress protein [Streptomyces sp. MBT65]MBK3576428.1 universal stress protein [Streptomyces sp. MBT65]